MKAAGDGHQWRCGRLAIRRWDAVASEALVHAKNLSERLKKCNSISTTDSSRLLGRAAPRKILRGARIEFPARANDIPSSQSTTPATDRR